MLQVFSFLINYPKEYTICILFFYALSLTLSFALTSTHLHLLPYESPSSPFSFRALFVHPILLLSMLLQTDAPVFDLSGRRVVKVVKGGLYIQNGKKFIVK